MIDADKGLTRRTLEAVAVGLKGTARIAIRAGLDADDVRELARMFYAIEARRYLRSQAAAWFCSRTTVTSENADSRQ